MTLTGQVQTQNIHGLLADREMSAYRGIRELRGGSEWKGEDGCATARSARMQSWMMKGDLATTGHHEKSFTVYDQAMWSRRGGRKWVYNI